ncbi:aspartate/glutamate racemase family protein [Virgibacillus sp. MSP4-1]|uniref:aspartate/glutamate racemase family protein n=1 Tax=Virgibacillus sp. MSP4-1 TaxID=2700081 RepID=UPI0003A886FF|nr:aspartate/glutamate racemase family protein [Virgibacillus sp. MSP4-1]QHS22453.1 aspartate/glutamate racemase family protein [Virgibacillus sp. MSP4-1]
MIYYANPGQVSYGETLGILMLDSYAPFIPGDIGNAHTFPFPVRYETVKGLKPNNMVESDDKFYYPFLEAARHLVQSGVKAITGDCGYMAIFQKRLSRDLKVPVFLSSLLQFHFLKHLIQEDEKIGVITANSNLLDQNLLSSIDFHSMEDPIVIKGLENEPNFRSFAIDESGMLDTEEVQVEVITAAKQLCAENPDIKMFLLECSMLPPYAEALQDEVDLPVFDYTSMINYVYSAFTRKPFDQGH